MTGWSAVSNSDLRPGNVVWLELPELPDRPRIAVEVQEGVSGDRIEVRALASDDTLFFVPFGRLFVRY